MSQWRVNNSCSGCLLVEMNHVRRAGYTCSSPSDSSLQRPQDSVGGGGGGGGALCSSTAFTVQTTTTPSWLHEHTWAQHKFFCLQSSAVHRDHTVASTSKYCICSVWHQLMNNISRTVLTCLYLVNWSIGIIDVHGVLTANIAFQIKQKARAIARAFNCFSWIAHGSSEVHEVSSLTF